MAILVQGSRLIYGPPHNRIGLFEIVNLGLPNPQAAKLDVTSHSSRRGYMEFMGGLIDPGELTVEVFFNPYTPSHRRVYNLQERRRIIPMTILLAPRGTGNKIRVFRFRFQAYFGGVESTANAADPLRATITIVISGPVRREVASITQTTTQALGGEAPPDFNLATYEGEDWNVKEGDDPVWDTLEWKEVTAQGLPVSQTPDDFTFDPVVDADPETEYTSNSIVITGIDEGSSIPIVTTDNATLVINGEDMQAGLTHYVENDDTVALRATSHPDPEGVVTVNLFAGDYFTDWTITTAAGGG